jgi:hypothetical protein
VAFCPRIPSSSHLSDPRINGVALEIIGENGCCYRLLARKEAPSIRVLTPQRLLILHPLATRCQTCSSFATVST